MPAYRLFFFRCGHIASAMELECRDDEAALEIAAKHAGGGRIELWDRARMIEAFEAAAQSRAG